MERPAKGKSKSAFIERTGAPVMPTIPRRVVTGHDRRGVSVFAGDGPVQVVRTAPDGAYFYEIWGTDAMPARIDAAEPDPTLSALTVPPPPHGTKIRINEFPPAWRQPRSVSPGSPGRDSFSPCRTT
jgi:hypothetical protein